MIKIFLTTKGVNVNSDDSGPTLLSWAMGRMHEKSVQVLVENRDGDVNYKDELGRTPLVWAMDHGYLELVGILLEIKEDVVQERGGSK